MLLENLVSSILSGLAVVFLVAAGLIFNTPANYIAIDGLPFNPVSKINLNRLRWFTIINALFQFIATAYFLQAQVLSSKKIIWESSLPLALSALAWLVVVLVATRLHRVQNATVGGHFSLFLVLILLLGSVGIGHYKDFLHLPIKWTTHKILSLAQVGVHLISIIVLGFYSDRQEVDDEELVSREKGASIFAQLSFTWLSPLIEEGNSKPIEQSDIWGLIDEDKSEYVLAQYFASKNPNHSLAWNIFKITYPYVIYQFTCSLMDSFLAFAGPFFLYQIISIIQVKDIDRITILPYLFGLFACSCTKAIVDGQLYFTGRRAGTRCRTILVAELYNKSLHRVQGTSSDDDEGASLGKIVTLMSVDSERVRTFISYAHDMFIQVPVSIVISISSLFLVLGWSAFVGIALIACLGPITTYLGKLVLAYQEELLANTDARVSIMNELLQGIRIVKYFAWEKHFAAKIEAARAKELNSFKKLWGSYMGFGAIGSGSGLLIAFVTFAVYTLVAGKNLDAATAFTSVSLLKVVSDLLSHLPTEIMMVFKAKVSLDRVESFLKETDIAKYSEKEKETDNDEELSDSNTIGGSEITLGFRNAEFSYYGTSGENEEPFTLRDMNVDFPIGGLTVICGPTGSGKSSLLLALLGELECKAGQYFLPNSNPIVDPVTGLSQTVAYAAQSAWLLNATIRDNILFGEEYDPIRYDRVVRACALAKDFETLEGGDLTEIGEKGINVSGGQKQRISLARACYSTASIVLLDDPLSAVDAPTARFLLHKCVLGVLKGRTVLLVSHATHLVVPFADRVIALKNGSIACQGTPAQVTQNPEDESLYGLDLAKDVFDDEKEGVNTTSVATAQGGGTTLVEDEEKATGSVRFAVYKSYFLAAGGIIFTLAFGISFFLTSGAKVVDDWWLKSWTDRNLNLQPVENITLRSYGPSLQYQSLQEDSQMYSNNLFYPNLLYVPPADKKSFSPVSPMSIQSSDNFHILNNKDDVDSAETMFYITIYALLGLGVVVANNIQQIVALVGTLYASRKLHTKLMDAVLHSPLRFFETTPIGRILNRFSKDIESVDTTVMDCVTYFIMQIIQALTIISVIGFVAPFFLLVMPIIMFVYVRVAERYLTASRELKRLESTTRSPTYAQFSETLAGVCTIRAYGAEERFSVTNQLKVDENHKPFFFVWAANRWLCLRTDVISAVVVLCAGLAIAFTDLQAGWAAMTFSYSLDFTNCLLWAVRLHAEMEMAMNSVERVEEYTDIDQEPPMIIESRRPAPNWPDRGTVEVRDVSIRYAPELPDVLKKVSFDIKAHEKVAVVGRTGAGKSTLSLAFFRILPLSSGSIIIDGEDIGELGLYDLRSRLTIIPQDPVLFTGTLRSNLDPLEENDDQTVWEALKRVNFIESMQQPQTVDESATDNNSASSESVNPSALTLDFPVTENGGNFSQGQRQLLCLARSLIQRNRIIFLDEATASVDNETDARIQATIRKEFFDSTIICIAHRLRTVIDYDKILVLDKGAVLEFGTPLDLIENSSNGTFRSMCEETGEFEELLEMARNAKINGQFKSSNY
ncbi:hypothetical protein HDV02_002915 [Globomyces sp. JEL0801]|nr:hypothetical protein HDV02_002915 [Globomyces sp. JEL0801]